MQDAGFDEEAGYRQQTIIDIPIIRHPGEPLQLQLAHFVDLIEGVPTPPSSAIRCCCHTS